MAYPYERTERVGLLLHEAKAPSPPRAVACHAANVYALECGDLSPLSRGDLSPSNLTLFGLLAGHRALNAPEQGVTSTISCILANLSMQLGRSLQWDPVQGKVVGDEEANRLLRRPYRAPWAHPEAGTV